VEAIETQSRTITLKKPDGTCVSVVAGPDIQRFAEVKLGDKVNARYSENVVVRVKPFGEPDVDTAVKGTTGSDRPCLGAREPSNRRSRPRSPTST